MKQKVLFVYNWVSDEKRTQEFRECATTRTVNQIKAIIESYQMEVICVNAFSPEQMGSVIEENLPLDVAFVIAEGFLDEPSSLFDGTGALRVRQVLESYNIPYTHSAPDAHEACRNKDITYKKLTDKVMIPRFFVFDQLQEEAANIEKVEYYVGYPMFLKPCGGGCSIGIDEKSVVNNREDLISKLQQLRGLIGDQPILAETYLSGREYTVGVVGNGLPHVLPIVAFPEDFQVRSQEVKRVEHKERENFEIVPFTESVGMKIQEVATEVFQALGANDLIRIDLKADHNGQVYVIDVNGTPSLSLTGSLAFMAENSSIQYYEFIGFVLYVTMSRNSLEINETLQQTADKVIVRLQGEFVNQIA
ncbi:ATP-grasp domain-containing protein [Anaerobacillus sp. MEB173]|uniref:D-alanine--D-alanine ligase family protein n=1 Tax=Anaerobacillus sp. MEB173 TaxID=3383345 RepID=UPI003F8FAC95